MVRKSKDIRAYLLGLLVGYAHVASFHNQYPISDDPRRAQARFPSGKLFWEALEQRHRTLQAGGVLGTFFNGGYHFSHSDSHLWSAQISCIPLHSALGNPHWQMDRISNLPGSGKLRKLCTGFLLPVFHFLDRSFWVLPILRGHNHFYRVRVQIDQLLARDLQFGRLEKLVLPSHRHFGANLYDPPSRDHEQRPAQFCELWKT